VPVGGGPASTPPPLLFPLPLLPLLPLPLLLLPPLLPPQPPDVGDWHLFVDVLQYQPP
jgi:hypothetical protein